jgi:hypothetical protein
LKSLEAEDEHERLVDGAELARVEPPGGAAESLGIDDRRLLDEDARLLTLQRDCRAEARGPSTSRGGRNEHRAHIEELVGLDDDGIASSALLSPARASRRRQAEDLAASHLSRAAVERALPAARG